MKIITVEFMGRKLKVLEGTVLMMFKNEMDVEEQDSFIQWGREHAGEEINPCYHPLVQDTMLRAQGVIPIEEEMRIVIREMTGALISMAAGSFSKEGMIHLAASTLQSTQERREKIDD